MKKLEFNLANSKQVLTKEQMKKVKGGEATFMVTCEDGGLMYYSVPTDSDGGVDQADLTGIINDYCPGVVGYASQV